MESNGRFILLLLFLIAQVNSQLYEVHWLNGTEPTRPERDVQSSKQNIDIYCYNGTAKSLSTLWQTVEFKINIENDEFSQYLGESPEEVYKYYKIINDSNINPFLKKTYKTVSLDIFKPTCMAVNTTQNYNIELRIYSFDIWRVLMMIIGVSLIFESRTLSGTHVFFYLYYLVVYVSALFMDFVYYVTRFLRTLQGVGFLVTVFSSQYQEISTVVAVLSLGAKYSYEYIQGYWPIRLHMDMNGLDFRTTTCCNRTAKKRNFYSLKANTSVRCCCRNCAINN